MISLSKTTPYARLLVPSNEHITLSHQLAAFSMYLFQWLFHFVISQFAIVSSSVNLGDEIVDSILPPFSIKEKLQEWIFS